MNAKLPEFWVFGYGSLMWRPGFDYLERMPALLHGFHRSLCVYSHVHRGTPECPGLVMGLDRGGACRGTAFRVAPDLKEPTLAYLRAREQVTSVYRELTTPIRLGGERIVSAVTYVVDRTHRQYAGKLSPQQQLEYIEKGQGQSGQCRDYVLNTLAHLREAGIHDAALEELAHHIGPHAATLAS